MADTPAGTKRGFFGPMKGLETARYTMEELPGGRVRAWIRHERMKGVTPAMLRWWFEHIDGETTYNGVDFDGVPVPVYRLWHPYDHIKVRWAKRVMGEDGRLGPGSVIAIQENLGAKYEVRSSARVTKFDDAAFNFELLAGGFIAAGSLDHVYAAKGDACEFITCMTLGVKWPLIGPLFNWLIRRLAFSDDMIRTWILHNIEESGETEKFVPLLYERAISGGA